MTKDNLSATIPQHMQGKRLDQALELLMPGSGLRERKRAWETGLVLVDGRPRPKGYRVMEGQAIALRPMEEGTDGDMSSGAVPEGVRVVGQNTGYMAALFKPGGVHSEPVAGRPGASVGACLQSFWPGRFAQLVNRLDHATSGLLAVALSEDAAAQYRSLEDAGRVTKVYAALVRGRVEGELKCQGRIDAAKRRQVRVLDDPDELAIRHTTARPLIYNDRDDSTLVRCLIHKGARHQIRAHLAHAGHPVVGDDLYGGEPEGRRLYLHHFRLSMPEFEAAVVPQWPEWDEWGLGKGDFTA